MPGFAHSAICEVETCVRHDNESKIRVEGCAAAHFSIAPKATRAKTTAVALTTQQSKRVGYHPPLTWSLVPRGTVAVRPCLSPAARIRIVACQDAVAFVRCAPVAFINAERFQGDADFIGRTVFKWRVAFWRHGTPRDVAVRALFESRTVVANRHEACSGSSLRFERNKSKHLPQVTVDKWVLSYSRVYCTLNVGATPL